MLVHKVSSLDNYTRHLTSISSAFSFKFWNDVPFPNSSPSALLTTHPFYTIKVQGKLPGGIDGSTHTPYARGQVLPYRNSSREFYKFVHFAKFYYVEKNV